MNLDLPTLNDGRLHLELSTDKICFDHLTGVGLGEEQYRFILVQHRAIQLAKRILEHFKVENEVPKVEEGVTPKHELNSYATKHPDILVEIRPRHKHIMVGQNGDVVHLDMKGLGFLSEVYGMLDTMGDSDG